MRDVIHQSVVTPGTYLPVRPVGPDGVAVRHDRYDLPERYDLLACFRGMVIGRRFNEQASALVRQGRLAVYPSSHGQEACQVAAAAARATGCSPRTATASPSPGAASTRSRS